MKEFEIKAGELEALDRTLKTVKDAKFENHYVRLQRTTRQLGEFILNHCDPTDEERWQIEEALRHWC